MEKQEEKIMMENMRIPTDIELSIISDVFDKFYKWRNERQGLFPMFQNNNLEDMLTKSRELFWNSAVIESEDLSRLGLSFNLGYARKEVKEFVGRLNSLNIIPHLYGEGLDSYGVKVLHSIYKNWSFHSNQKVERFWKILYGLVNGTICEYVGFNDATVDTRYLRKYNRETKEYQIQNEKRELWNDVWAEVVPLENVYLPKYYERNIQRQGKLIWRTQMKWKEFKEEFKTFDNAEYVYPGNMIAEDSLYFRLLSGTGITTTDKIEVFKYYDVIKDEYIVIANGILINPLGKGKKIETSPIPFNHKKLPFVWSIIDPIDEKLAYGMPMPFSIKDPHKILNTSVTMLVEKELRGISPPILTSDLEAPDLIYGNNKVIPVQDVEAYKTFHQDPTNPEFFSLMSGLQNTMTEHTQGGFTIPIGGKQPKSSREMMIQEQTKQLFLSNALLLYYDMLRQEIELVLKTAVQFYSFEKYEKQRNRVIRSIKIPNSSLTGGGIGDLNIRLVKGKTKSAIELLMESIQKASTNNKLSEIIEVPVDVFEKLDFDITSIDLEPEKASELEQLSFVEKVITPMTQIFMPMGLVDPQKLLLRFLEKMKEHPVDYVPEKLLPNFYGIWNQQYQFPVQGMMGNQPGQVLGNMQQMNRGTQFGGQNISKPFGSPRSQPLNQMMTQ